VSCAISLEQARTEEAFLAGRDRVGGYPRIFRSLPRIASARSAGLHTYELTTAYIDNLDPERSADATHNTTPTRGPNRSRTTTQHSSRLISPESFAILLASRLDRVKIHRTRDRWGILLRRQLNQTRIFDINVATVWYFLENLPEDHPVRRQHHPLDPDRGDTVQPQPGETEVHEVQVPVQTGESLEEEREDTEPTAPVDQERPSRRRQLANAGVSIIYQIFARREWLRVAYRVLRIVAERSPYAAGLLYIVTNLSGNDPSYIFTILGWPE
jgi:hypothetical protein